ncbi:hypothetical protein B0O99DRAFT_596287 [Bisporella sp. PMI_857]|nr:hypothetical protein B0O99DRAFT_596287 [Bisporella sp. PMI_857]
MGQNLDNKQWIWDLLWRPDELVNQIVPGQACVTRRVYNNIQDATAVKYLGCGAPYFGGVTYYRTIPTDARVVTTTEGAQTTSSTGLSADVAETSLPVTSSTSSTRTSSTRTTSSTTSPTTHPTSASTSNSDESNLIVSSSTTKPDSVNQTSETTSAPGSKSGPSSSDKIALGVGLGIGLPSVTIGLLAWCYPRRRYLSVKHPDPPQGPNVTPPMELSPQNPRQ